MADDSTKAIEDVDPGDEVMVTDPETGRTEVDTVTAKITGDGVKHLVKVTIDTDGDQGSETTEVTATDGHPFWVPELGEWVEATELQAGQWLQTSAGTYVQISTVDRWSVPRATVHNLTVANTHTYYVMAGNTPVLVHNCDGEVDWVKESSGRSDAAQDYEDGAHGAMTDVATRMRRVPALDYVNLEGDLRQVKFDGFDEANGVLIDRKLGVRTQEKTQRAAINQSMALEQNGYTGRWEVANQRAANRANRMFGRLGIANIVVEVVKP